MASDNKQRPDRMFWIKVEPVDGGWVARCEETGLSAFGRTPDAAWTKIVMANEQWRQCN